MPKIKKSPKVLWVHNFPKKDGAGGVWMYNQYDYLKNEVDLYYADRLRNPIWFARHMFRLLKLARRYEVVHAQYGSAVGFLTSLMPAKRILSLKGSDWYSSPPKNAFHQVRILLGGMLTRFAIGRFDHVIVMSNRMKELVLKKFPKLTVEVVIDPIDLDKFAPISNGQSNPVKKVLFASVNLNNPIKRFDLAEQSFAVLKSKMPDVMLVTMTNIPHDQVCAFMNGIDVLLLTSTHEGWPNVVKEALACNKPFVATNVSDLKLIANRTNNCFVCSDSPQELGKALEKSLRAEAEQLRVHVENMGMKENLDAIRRIYQKHR